MVHPDIVIGGKKIGRFRASILLFKESLRFISSDKEMLAIPVIAIVFQLALLAIGSITLLSLGLFGSVASEGTLTSPREYIVLFLWYIIGAFTLAWTQAAIAHIVYVRAHNGNATLGEGMSIAFRNWSALLLWAIITSTVGIALRMIAERSHTVVRILVAVMGAAWSVLTYFVVPSIVIGKRSAFTAISDSGSVFRRTWGETLMTNISYTIVFVLAFTLYVLALFGLGFAFGWTLGIVLTILVLFTFGCISMSLVGATMSSVLRTLLYMYASEQVVPTNFNKELLEQMLSRKNGSTLPQGTGTSFV